MAQVKLDTKNMTDGVIITTGLAIHTALDGSVTFPNPTPPLPAFLTLVTTAQTKLTAYEASRQDTEMLREEKDEAIAALVAAMGSEAGYVQGASGGNAALILSAGMQVRNPGSPIGQPAQVVDLNVTANSLAGALLARWKPVRGAKSYEVETSPDPLGPDSWGNPLVVTGSRTQLTGLPSVTRVWVRVRAVGAAGPGAWSAPSVKTVP